MHRTTTKWHLDPSSRLGTIDMGLKLGALPPFWRGELSPHLAQCGLGWGLPPYQVSSWSIQLFGHNRHGPKKWGLYLLSPFPYQVASWSIQPFGHHRDGRKMGRLCSLLGRGAGSPSSTMWPGPRPTSTPSGIVIHPAVWPQLTWAENWGGDWPLSPFCGGGSLVSI